MRRGCCALLALALVLLVCAAAIPLAQSQGIFEKRVTMEPIETEVVVADYALLRRSFPCRLTGKSDAQINDWLKREAGYFRKTHLDAIPAGEDRPQPASTHLPKTGRVPPNYGRAALVRATGHERCRQEPEWLDIKGTGTESPKWEAFHRSGVLELTGALQEFFIEKWISFLYRLPGHTLSVTGANPTYAVLAIKHVSSPTATLWQDPHGTIKNISEGWGILVRNYAARDGNYALDISRQYAVEGWLRGYGLSGLLSPLLFYYPQEAQARDPATMPLVLDYQKTHSNALIDFSAVGLFQVGDLREWHPGQSVFAIQHVAGFDESHGCFNVKTEILLKNTLDNCLRYLKHHEMTGIIQKLVLTNFQKKRAEPNPFGLRKAIHPSISLSMSYLFFLATSWWELWEPAERAVHWPQIVHALADHRHWQPHYQAPFQHLFTTFQLKLKETYSLPELRN